MRLLIAVLFLIQAQVGFAQLVPKLFESEAPDMYLHDTGSGVEWRSTSTLPYTGPWLSNGSSRYYSAGNIGIGVASPAERLHILGTQLIQNSSGNSINGQTALKLFYSGDNVFNTLGSHRSSSNWVLGYAVAPDPAIAESYLSTLNNFNAERGALSVGKTFSFLTAGSTNAPIGSSVQLVSRFSINNAGEVTLGNRAGAGNRYAGYNSSGMMIEMATPYSSTNPQPYNGRWITSGSTTYITDDISIGLGTPTATLGVDIKRPVASIPAAQVRGYIATGDSGAGVAGDLLIAPRTSVSANIRFITGTTPTERMLIGGNGEVTIMDLAGSGDRYIGVNSTGLLKQMATPINIFNTATSTTDFGSRTGKLSLGATAEYNAQLYVKAPANMNNIELISDALVTRMQFGPYAMVGTLRGTGSPFMSKNLYPSSTVSAQYKFMSPQNSGSAFELETSRLVYKVKTNTTPVQDDVATMIDRFEISSSGVVRINGLSGAGNRMVIANSGGYLTTGTIPTADNLGNHAATQSIDLGINAINSNGNATQGLSFSASNDAKIEGAFHVDMPDFKTTKTTVEFGGNERIIQAVYSGQGDDLVGNQAPQTRSYVPERLYTQTAIGSSLGTASYGFNRWDAIKGNASEADDEAHISFSVPTGQSIAIKVEGLYFDVAGLPHYFTVAGASTEGSTSSGTAEVSLGMVTADWYTSTAGDVAFKVIVPAGADWGNGTLEVVKGYDTGFSTLATRFEFRTTDL
jgi:hypothetical protein